MTDFCESFFKVKHRVGYNTPAVQYPMYKWETQPDATSLSQKLPWDPGMFGWRWKSVGSAGCGAGTQTAQTQLRVWAVWTQTENSPFQLVDRGPAPDVVAIPHRLAPVTLPSLLPPVRVDPGALALCRRRGAGNTFLGRLGGRVVQGNDGSGCGDFAGLA